MHLTELRAVADMKISLLLACCSTSVRSFPARLIAERENYLELSVSISIPRAAAELSLCSKMWIDDLY